MASMKFTGEEHSSRSGHTYQVWVDRPCVEKGMKSVWRIRHIWPGPGFKTSWIGGVFKSMSEAGGIARTQAALRDDVPWIETTTRERTVLQNLSLMTEGRDTFTVASNGERLYSIVMLDGEDWKEVGSQLFASEGEALDHMRLWVDGYVYGQRNRTCKYPGS